MICTKEMLATGGLNVHVVVFVNKYTGICKIIEEFSTIGVVDIKS